MLSKSKALPRSMDTAPAHRVLIQDIDDEWAIGDPSSMPAGVLRRAKGWLPLPDQDGDTP